MISGLAMHAYPRFFHMAL